MQIFSAPYSLKQLCLAAALFGAGALGLALVSQYGFGLHPCPLCIDQRWAYGVALAGGVLGFLTRKPVFFWVTVLGLAATGLIAVYHSGVELGWFASGCVSEATAGMTLEEMRAQIMGAPLVSCNQPQGVVLGLSMANWNILAGLGSACALMWLRRRR